MDNEEILVIDDETAIRRLLEITLQSHGYKVLLAATAKEGLEKTAYHTPDLVILDLGLPDESGHDTLKKIREWSRKPIIVLSVLNNEEDIVSALDNGANDYLVKPFRTGELLARIRSALRVAAVKDDRPIVSFDGFEIDLSLRTVKKDNEIVRLTATQYALLALFGRNEGKVLTHQYMLREIWGKEYVGQLQYLRVFIAQLRKKIEKDANRPEHIITESGVGYRFMASQP